MWRWSARFFDGPAEAQLPLGEGDTPLIRAKRLGAAVGLENLHFKLEMVSPAGLYKDRFAAAAVADMRANGKTHCIATSSGNTGAALAAYCAAADIRCEVAIVETAPADKLKQMLAYGADIYKVRGFGIDADVTQKTFDHLRRLADHPQRALQISAYCYSPAGMRGVETIGYELAEQAPAPIDHVFCPAGGGGLIVAMVRSLQQMCSEGVIERVPRVECVQPEGNDTMCGPLRERADRAREVQCTTTISGLQVPNVNDGHEVVQLCPQTGGTGHLVTDEEVYATQARLAREEGIFCEPAAAVATAGALKARRAGEIESDAVVVCVVTGSGFKDQNSVDRMIADVDCPLIEPADLFRRS